MTPEQRRLQAKAAAHVQSSRERDRTARTAPGRTAFLQRFEREVDPEGKLPPDVRAKMAASARRAYFTRLSLRSSRVRAARRASRL